MATHFPDLGVKTFVKVIQEGPTAGLVYVDDSKERDATNKPRVTFTFIEFINEKGDWRYHGLANVGDLKYKEDGTLTEFRPNELPAKLAIDGRVLEAPAPIEKPDVVGMLDIFSYGYATQVYVNDVKQSVAADISSSGLLQGGLRKGDNALRVIIQRTSGEYFQPPTVTIRLVQQDEETAKIFTFKPPQDVVGTHDFNFMVEDK